LKDLFNSIKLIT